MTISSGAPGSSPPNQYMAPFPFYTPPPQNTPPTAQTHLVNQLHPHFNLYPNHAMMLPFARPPDVQGQYPFTQHSLAQQTMNQESRNIESSCAHLTALTHSLNNGIVHIGLLVYNVNMVLHNVNQSIQILNALGANVSTLIGHVSTLVENINRRLWGHPPQPGTPVPQDQTPAQNVQQMPNQNHPLNDINPQGFNTPPPPQYMPPIPADDPPPPYSPPPEGFRHYQESYI
jgi:hypothetical protein